MHILNCRLQAWNFVFRDFLIICSLWITHGLLIIEKLWISSNLLCWIAFIVSALYMIIPQHQHVYILPWELLKRKYSTCKIHLTIILKQNNHFHIGLSSYDSKPSIQFSYIIEELHKLSPKNYFIVLATDSLKCFWKWCSYSMLLSIVPNMNSKHLNCPK